MPAKVRLFLQVTLIVIVVGSVIGVIATVV